MKTEEDIIEELAQQIADVLSIHPDHVGLSQTWQGYFADVYTGGKFITSEFCEKPEDAMRKLYQAVRG